MSTSDIQSFTLIIDGTSRAVQNVYNKMPNYTNFICCTDETYTMFVHYILKIFEECFVQLYGLYQNHIKNVGLNGADVKPGEIQWFQPSFPLRF